MNAPQLNLRAKLSVVINVAKAIRAEVKVIMGILLFNGLPMYSTTETTPCCDEMF